uniref:zinc ribbon domain-containing protein n=1 Tax=Rhodovarius sp. TaxID=2972673 RepID=UPI003340E273
TAILASAVGVMEDRPRLAEYRIIDDAVWAVVQARLDADAAPPNAGTGQQKFWEKRRGRYLLSGRLICGKCGAPFAANTRKTYTCNNVQRGMCDNRAAICRDVLEERVLETLAEKMMDPEVVQAFAEEFAAEWNRLTTQLQAAAPKLQRDLDVAERRLANLLEAIADGLRGPRLQAKLEAAEAETQRLHAAISNARPAIIRIRPDIGAVYRAKLQGLRAALAAADNPAALEAARALIERVIIHPAGRRGVPDITVEGHLAAMLDMAQPGLGSGAASESSSGLARAISTEVSNAQDLIGSIREPD